MGWRLSSNLIKMSSKNYLWRLHYEKDGRIIETSSLNMQIFDAPNGDSTYFFQIPGPYKSQKEKVHLFLYETHTYIEWLDDDKALIKSLKFHSRAEVSYDEGVLKVWVKSNV